MSKKLQEIFSAPAGDLERVAVVAGASLFTSTSLKEKYLKAMEKTDKTAPIIKAISTLIEKKILFPVYSTDKILKSILKLHPVQIRNFAGFVSGDKKIFILIETDANIFAFTSNEALASTTIHEIIHYIASYHLSYFFNIFKDDLQNFYKYYFCKLLGCDEKLISNQQIEPLVKFINFKLEQNAFSISNSLLKEYYDLIIKTFQYNSTLNEATFINTVTQIIVLIKLLQKLASVGTTQHFSKVITAYRNIIFPLYTTYKYTFGVNPLTDRTLCFQELWSTSEVIAVPSITKRPNSKVYQAISKL